MSHCTALQCSLNLGLGTSTSKEAKEYFSDMPRHRITFHYGGGEDDASLSLAFSKKKVEERKEWLTNYMQERKRRTEIGLSEASCFQPLTCPFICCCSSPADSFWRTVTSPVCYL